MLRMGGRRAMEGRGPGKKGKIIGKEDTERERENEK